MWYWIYNDIAQRWQCWWHALWRHIEVISVYCPLRLAGIHKVGIISVSFCRINHGTILNSTYLWSFQICMKIKLTNYWQEHWYHLCPFLGILGCCLAESPTEIGSQNRAIHFLIWSSTHGSVDQNISPRSTDGHFPTFHLRIHTLTHNIVVFTWISRFSFLQNVWV